jgi:hypothetical protein
MRGSSKAPPPLRSAPGGGNRQSGAVKIAYVFRLCIPVRKYGGIFMKKRKGRVTPLAVFGFTISLCGFFFSLRRHHEY